MLVCLSLLTSAAVTIVGFIILWPHIDMHTPPIPINSQMRAITNRRPAMAGGSVRITEQLTEV